MTKFSSQGKNLIRKKWGKEIIKYISKHLNSKLVYLGLPSPDAKDIDEWIEYIDEVIAFQCRDYPNPSSPKQDKKNIEQLQSKLSEYERKGIIQNYVVYDGYIEEVILKKRDNSGIPFELNNTVHIFNLDFCNSITSPLEIIDYESGEVNEVYKFDALKILIELQKLVNSDIKKFVLFLTLKSSYDGKELEDFNASITHKISTKELSNYETKIRFLRHYVLHTLKSFFESNGFVISILPTIEYEGDRQHKLLHFTVIGTNKNNDANPVAPSFQQVDNLIKEKFISINDGDFVEKDTSKITETQICCLNPVDFFKSTQSYKKFWN